MANENVRLIPVETGPGCVSGACRFVDEGGVRTVLVRETPVYIYPLDDKVASRQIWVNVYESGHASQKQIADATGTALRTLHYWVSRHREMGAKGLVDRPRSGAPRKVTEGVRKRIYRLRDGGGTIPEIARLCQISVGSVEGALRQRQIESKQRERKLVEESEGACVSEAVTSAEQAGSGVTIPEARGVAAEDSRPGRDAVERLEALDREADRMMARVGLIQDAEPLFAEGEKVEWAGAFMAAVVLGSDPLLRVFKELYGEFKAAFYGVRTVVMTLALMALLRIKRVEHLRGSDPVKFGRILGLDRVAEVKTMRRKLHQLVKRGDGVKLMQEMARARAKQYEGDPRIVMIDGHVQIYSGEAKIGQVYSARASRVVKGRTETWVHLPGQQPLLSVMSPFNEGLIKTLPEAVEKARAVIGEGPLTCVFDRGGWSSSLFQRLISQQDHFITYRKGKYPLIEDRLFQKEPTLINGRDYEYRPHEQTVEIPIYEEAGVGKKGGVRYKKTRRTLKLRDIRIRRRDGGQTSILTSREDLSSTEVAATLFDRWGSQENGFKYMMEEFGLDTLWDYGVEQIEEAVDHPHPDYVKLQKEISLLQEQRKTLLGRMWNEIEGQGDADEEKLTKHLLHHRRGDEVRLLREIGEKIREVRCRMKEMPQRQTASAGHYRQLKSEMKLISNVIRMAAYSIETRLLEMLTPRYANAEKEGRKLIAAALRTSGSIQLKPGQLVIRLEPQSSPNRTRAINALCEQLTAKMAKYPGSYRTIVFEPTPIPS